MTSNAAFKKRVRELAAQQDIPYTAARSRLLGTDQLKSSGRDAPAPKSTASAPAHEFAEIIGAALIARSIELATADRLADEAELAWAEDRERGGLRIVVSGQTGSPDEDGRSDWSTKDWRTGDMLASGHSTYEEVTWEENWIDISQADSLDVANYDETAVLDALPDGTAPQLERFISQLVESMDYQDWPREFADWLNEERG